MAGPRVEEVLRGDGPAGGVALPDRQVLLEGAAVARDAGLVDLLVLVDVVRAAVAGDVVPMKVPSEGLPPWSSSMT